MKLKLKKKKENNTIVHNNILSSHSCLFFFVYSKTTDNRKKHHRVPPISPRTALIFMNFDENQASRIPEIYQRRLKRNKTKPKKKGKKILSSRCIAASCFSRSSNATTAPFAPDIKEAVVLLSGYFPICSPILALLRPSPSCPPPLSNATPTQVSCAFHSSSLSASPYCQRGKTVATARPCNGV